MLAADIAHIAGLIAGGAHPSPVGHADVVTTTTHKTLRGPRGAMILCDAEHAQRDRPRGVPRPAGRAARPHHGGDRGRAARGRAAGLRRLRARDRGQRRGAAPRRCGARGFDLVSGGTDNHLLLVDLTAKGIGGRPAAEALERAGHRLQLQRGPVRPAQADGPVGHPARHAGGDDPRPGRGAHGRRRALDRRGRRRGPPRATRPRWSASAARSRELARSFSPPGLTRP